MRWAGAGRGAPPAAALAAVGRGSQGEACTEDAKKAAPKEEVKKIVEKPATKLAEGEIPAEVQAAISMALYLSTNLHDEESNVITIERRVTSWNDKNYGVRHWKR